MKNVFEYIEERMKIDLGTAVYFIYEGKVYQRRIRGIVIPEILFSPSEGYKNVHKFQYYMGREVITGTSYLMRDEDNMLIAIDADKVFESKEDLLNSL